MDELSQAVVLFTGWKTSPFPRADETRLVEAFGPGTGPEMVARVRSILDELARMEPDWGQHSLASGAAWAVARLKLKHPQLDGEAVRALEWKFAYSWK